MKILVTGGPGFIGSHIVERLLHWRDDVRIVDNFCTDRRSNFVAGRPPRIFGGQQSRNLTYVDNVVDANLAALTVSGVGGRVANMACGERITPNRLVAELQARMSVDIEPNSASPRAGDILPSLADIRRRREELGYVPRVEFTEGLRRTVEHAAGRAAPRPGRRAGDPDAAWGPKMATAAADAG